ncbi:hypothetical protein JHK84_048453 [Glycine max]|nr:hypothetical protein JHK84_048453 [Glycine max]
MVSCHLFSFLFSFFLQPLCILRCVRPSSPSPLGTSNFSTLPYDVLTKIVTSSDDPNIRAKSLVCRAWGKPFKNDHCGTGPNANKALDSFIKATVCGSTLTMVDVSLICWARGKKPKAMEFYLKAAKLGNLYA